MKNNRNPFDDRSNGNTSNRSDEFTIVDPMAVRRTLDPSEETNSFRDISKHDKAKSLPPRRGPNPLERGATALLNLMLSLKNTLSHPDITDLHSQIMRKVEHFRALLAKTGIPGRTLEDASYAVCATLDDIVLNDTAWGMTSLWPQQSLLVTFHQDFRGGGEFFNRLDDLLRQPVLNKDVLKLMYLCLALGFKGRYRKEAGKLEEKREQLFRTLYALPRDEETDLSPSWQGVVNRQRDFSRLVPFWVLAAAACALLLSLYTTLLYRINDASEPVAEGFENVSAPLPYFQRQKTEPMGISDENSFIRLKTFLAPEIRQKQIEVSTMAQGVMIRISRDDLFESASASLNPNYGTLIQRIAEAVKSEPGKLLITGHTDNIPIRTIKYPSNSDLSKARAETVAQSLIAGAGDADRFSAKGLGAAKPLCSNQTAVGRACNRRVEIVLAMGRP